jgi:hypothetical protein
VATTSFSLVFLGLIVGAVVLAAAAVVVVFALRKPPHEN